MNIPLSNRERTGFTLLELLLVVVIVAILAALLLPVLSKAKGRARQIECLSQLKQVGVAYQTFAHDHADRFPFQVPLKESGTLELVQAAASLGGDVQYAFRHFQALSNDLPYPKLLSCPSDKRTNAPAFPSLRNEHISYFVAVTAEYGRPDSVLGGDRNIVARNGGAGSILRLNTGADVAWTHECHEFKGNLLFAGGHVERTGNAGLQVALRSPTGPVSAWIPVASSSGDASAPAGGGVGGGASAGGPGKGGGASGFAALQNFFQSPQNPGNAAPAASPPAESSGTPAFAAKPPAPAAPRPPPVTLPVPVPKPATNQIAATPAPVPLPPSTKPRPAFGTEPAPSVLVLFLEPERCWWCWWLFLLVCITASVILGILIQRRHQKRRTSAAVSGIAPAGSSRSAAS